MVAAPRVSSDGPLFGPYPDAIDWHDARVANGHPPCFKGRGIDRLSQEDWTNADAHHKAWDNHRKRQEAKQRATHRATLPHPNWQNRRPTCIVPVPGPLTGGMGEITKAKQSPWIRATRACDQPCVAFDGTDRRAVGFLYGVCDQHLLRALYDDPTREWWWRDGTPLARTADLETHLAFLALAGR